MIAISLSRREFLGTTFKAGVLVSLPSNLWVNNQESAGILSPSAGTLQAEKTPLRPSKKVISFYNNHTGEFLKNCTFWADNKFCSQALLALNQLCRDHRTGFVKAMDPQLFVFLHQILEQVETTKIVNIVSGYRSEASNQYLREKSRGVARSSHHTKGEALDFYIQGVSVQSLYKAALSLDKGGVGGYNQFIHIDTGRVRKWGSLGV